MVKESHLILGYDVRLENQPVRDLLMLPLLNQLLRQRYS